MPRVAIFGGGVGGLTVAHQLSSIPGYEITIYEKKSEVGGLARSRRDKNGCATEYCWRVFFGFYHNLLQILTEIPDGEGTCRDNLRVYEHVNIMNPTSTSDKMVAYMNILRGITSCDERLDAEDDLTWYEALGSASKSNLFREIGGWLGMDRYKGAYRSVIKVGMEMQILPSYCSEFGLCSNYEDYVTTKPSSEAVFDPWMKLLKSRGVKFRMEDSLEKIESDGENIVGAITSSGEFVNADQYVLSLPVEELYRVLFSSRIKWSNLRNIETLVDTCLHIQLSYQVYFDRPLLLGDNKNAFLLVESPWDIIVLSYDRVYHDTEICFSIKDAKGAWSVAICTAYIPGVVHKKTFMESTYDEVIDELTFQLLNNKILSERISMSNDIEWNEDLILGWSDTWPTFENGSKNHKLTTEEPKFTNNAGSYKLRPSFKTEYSNLHIATGYIRETIDIFSMEAACIAGKRTSHSIESRCLDATAIKRPLVLAPLRAIDKLCFTLKLPNVLTTAVFALIAIIIVFAVQSK